MEGSAARRIPIIDGRYEVLGELGSGGFGVVYQVADRQSAGARRAMKTVSPGTDVQMDDVLARFQQEARLIATLKHRGIPKIWAVGADASVGAYYVIDYVDGITLLEKLDGTDAVTDRLRLAVEFVDTLAAVHAAGVLHRDIKPENILVPADGTHVQLIDFGIAKSVGGGGVRTRDGYILATPYYLTPEQLHGRPYTVKSDLYQAGLVLFHVMTGARAFPADASLLEFETLRRNGPARELLDAMEWDARVTAAAGPVLACLAYDPARRPASAAGVRDALEAMVALLEGRPDESRAGGDAPGVAPASRPAGEAAGARARGHSERARAALGAAQAVLRAVPPADASDRETMRAGAAHARLPVGGGVAAGAGRSTPRWGLVAMGAGAGLLAIGLLAVMGLRGRATGPGPRPGRATTAAVVVPASGTAAGGGTASPPGRTPRRVDLGRALSLALTKAKNQIDERWLEGFAKEHKARITGKTRSEKDGQAVAAALRAHLERVGVLGPLEAFLAQTPAYFEDASIPETERWGLRSALCDVELVEYFCEEHHVPWALNAKVSTCAGKWDEPVEPWKMDLRSVKSWIRWESGKEGPELLGATITDGWALHSLPQNARCILWYSMLDWRSGLVLDVSVNSGFRRLLRCSSPPTCGAIAIHAVEEWSPGSIRLNTPVLMLPKANWSGHRAYVGTQVPAWSLRVGDTQVRTLVIEIPYATTGAGDPNLRDRVVSYLTTN